ncbi:MAG: hypothetical protein F6K35_43510 [Okeania sp. SIO2H7]|nr:hypothetical protein [Okeania sp. SIO2H7]
MNINMKYWKERIAKQEAENQKLAEQARKEANLIVEVLIGEFGITILFGMCPKARSVARNEAISLFGNGELGIGN